VRTNERVPRAGIMEEAILDIQNGIRMGRYANEAAVSRGIVQRVLHGLGWPIFDTTVVCAEYALEGRRVDYALCHPPRDPLVFIEVKRVGQGDDAERQLFDYAICRMVPLAVLTTGQVWHFFLPGERGDYGDRRVYTLDLLEREPAESVSWLFRYLGYQEIVSGAAIEAAKDDLRNAARQRDIRRTLPEAWRKLIEEQDELLCELVAEKVESLCGFRPDLGIVVEFIARVGATPDWAPPTPLSTATPVSHAAVSEPKTSTGGDRSDGAPSFTFRGQRHIAASGTDVIIRVFRILADLDPSFLERFAARPKRGKRRCLARSARELYPGREDLAEKSGHAYELSPGSGWWLDVHNDGRRKLAIIQAACEVAGLEFGKDLVVDLP
jgi:hypothetical protein